MSRIFNALRLNEAAVPGADGEVRIAAAERRMEDWSPTLARVVPVRLSDAAALLAPGQSFAAEQYRIARTKVIQVLPRPFRLAITSPGIGDGKTMTAVNLAIALALKSETPTLLIDADLRRASVHRRFDVPINPGVAGILSGACRFQDAIFRTAPLPSLYVLPAGEPERNPTELLDSAAWHDLADTAQRHFPQVVVDCPPAEVLADYDLIAAVCDSSILVLRPDHTDRELATAALAKLKPKLAGVLINSFEQWFLWRKPARHGRYYYYERKGGRE